MVKHYVFRQHFCTVKYANDVLYNVTAESIKAKKLGSRFSSMKKISFMRKNCEVAFLSHCLGDLAVT